MIANLIRWSIANRFLVLLATLMISAWGLWSLGRTPVDALPDLSDVQVIVRTTWPGQAPQIVENQVTYPLTTTMLSVRARRRCVAIRSLVTRSSTCCSKTGRIPTGRDPGCSST